MKKKQKQKKRSAAILEALEPRVLFSADLFGGAIDVSGTDDPLASLLDEAAASLSLSKAQVDQSLDQTTGKGNARAAADEGEVAPVTISATDSATIEPPRHELVVVDTATPDYQQLVDDILAQTGDERTIEVVLLDARQDGLDQLGGILSGYSGLDAVHLISHGGTGEIHIGNGTVDLATLEAQADRVATWGASLSNEADLLIYGCNLSSNSAGQLFVDSLAQLTGADVAASDDLTGHESLGGDWELEYQAGDVETVVAVSDELQATHETLLAANLAPSDLQAVETESGGLSLNQDGGNDAYLIADDGNATLGGLSALTAEVRFSMDTFPNSTNFFSFVTKTDFNTFKFNIRDNGDLSLSINDVKLNSSAMDYRLLADGLQHTLSVTWNSSGGVWEMFVDGASKDSGSGLETGQLLDDFSGAELVIGNDQDSIGSGFDPASEVAATIYDARIFNDVRTTAEIADNFGRTLASTESGMIANWTFNDLSTSGVIVDTVSGNNLTVQNVGSGGGFVTSTPELTFEVRENATDGTVVGSLAGIDPDTGDTLTYSLQDDAAGRFDIDPGTGVITVADATSINFADATTHSITIRVTDTGAQSYDELFTISVRPTTITVDTTVDYNTGDARYGDTSSIEALLADKGTDNRITFREAIDAANKSENGIAPDEIHFNIALDDSGHSYYRDNGGAGYSAPVTTTLDDGSIGDFDADYPGGAGAGYSWWRIQPGSALPDIVDSVVIDATTQTGYDGKPRIVINGSGAGTADGLRLTTGSAGSTISGLVINQFNGDGIQIDSAGGHTIAGNYIGTDVTGTVDLGNTWRGINIDNTAGNTIGGTNTADRNVISGNNNDGIIFWNSGATLNVVQGNYIGIDATGTAALGNTQDGIAMGGGANNNTVGGATATERNVISGNADGVEIDNDSDGNKIYGNYIGINAAGTDAVANLRHGVVLYDGASETEIGGSLAGQGNVISGNAEYGIIIDGAGGATTTNNTIAGNYIGLDKDGSNRVANIDGGIYLFHGANANIIGGTNTNERNVISGNQGAGIYITGNGTDDNEVLGNYLGTNAAGNASVHNWSNNIDINTGASDNIIGGAANGAGNTIAFSGNDGITLWSATTTGNIVQGNFIGTNATETLDLGNSNVGINVSGDANDNLIGGTETGEGNVIANNNDDGVRIKDSGTINNTILGNSIYNNTGAGIDLQNDGVTANDSGDGDTGSNKLQNYPVVTQAYLSGTELTLSGTLDTDWANTQYRIEFYGIPAIDTDATNGEGCYYLGATTITTNGTADGSFSNIVLSGITLSGGDFVTATATKIDAPAMVGINELLAYGNSSEFAVNFEVTANTAPSDIVFDSESSTEETVNTYGTSDQIDPAIAAFDDGGYVVVWVSNAQDGSGYGIYGQRYNADGTTNGTEFLVTSETTDSETNPSVATFADGGFVVAWQDQTSGVWAWSEARVYNADGSAATADFKISPGVNGDNEGYQPAVVALNANDFVVVWANEVSASTYEVAGQIYDRTGATVGSQFSVGSLLTGNALYGAQTEITLLDDGGFAVVWRTNDGSDLGTRARVMNADGTARSPQITLTGDNIADISSLSNGGFVVTYDSAGDLKAAIYDFEGRLDVAEFTVNTTTSAARHESTVTRSADGFVAAWESSAGDGNGSAILAQRFDQNGNKIDGEVVVNHTIVGNQQKPEIIETASGQVIAVWQSENVDAGLTGIVSRVVTTGNASVDESAVNGTRVADALGVRDADIGDTRTYSLTDNAGGRFAINNITGEITVANAALIDYETSSSHNITVRVTDLGTNTYDEVLTINVNDVNDSPTVGSASLPFVPEDTVNPPGETVGNLFSGSFSDVDGVSSMSGVLITNNPENAAQGVWQYSTDDGSIWYDVGTIAYPASLALDVSAKVRFVPTADYNGSPTGLSLRALDNTYASGFTSGASKVTHDASSPGVNSPISSSLVSINTTISPVNDDPTNSGSLPTDVIVTEDTPGYIDLSSINFEDVDAGNNLIQVTLSTSNGGVLTASSDFDVIVYGSGFSTMTLQGGVSALNNFFSSEFRFQYSNPTTHLAGGNADTIQITVNDLGNTGSGGGANIDFGTVNVDITAVNDAPINTVPGTQTVPEETATAIAGISISDIDASVSNVTTRLQVSNGVLNTTLSGSAIFSVGANGSNDLTIQGTVTDINATLASLSYTGNSDITGTAADTLIVTTNDAGNSGSGGAKQNVDNIQIDITATNDAPVFTAADGIIIMPNNNGNDAGEGVVQQVDGKILIGGYTHNGSNWDFTVTRYNSNGSLDTDFGTGGIVSTGIGSNSDVGTSITLQDDGKILIGGYYVNGAVWDFAITRYNSDGSLDSSFGGGDGKATAAIGSSLDAAMSLVVQTDGKILLAGQSDNGTNNDFALTRFNIDGSLDTSFGGGDGIVTTPIGSGSDIAYSMTLQADGKILLAGQSNNGTNNDFALTRYNSDGSLDNSFGGGDGIVTTALGSGTDRAYGVTVQTDGKILLAGLSHNGSNDDFALTRYNSDGTLDSGFGGGDGIVTTAIGLGNDIAHSISVQSDGKIILAGESQNGAVKDFALVRYNSDGTLDTGFGKGSGIVTTNLGGSDIGRGMSLQSDGKILVTGTSHNGTDKDIALVRFNTDGSLDTNFDMQALNANPTFIEDGSPVVLDTDVTIFDAELSAADNFDGATLTLVRNTGANSEDIFSATGTLSALTQGSSLVVGGTTIGTVTTNSAGTLVLTFNSNATNTLVNSAMQQIAYSNSSDAPPANVQIDWRFDDGNSGTQGSGGALQAVGNITVDITAVNDAPTFGFGDGIVTTDFGSGDDAGYTVSVLADGKLLVAGQHYNGSDFDFALTRYNTDGTLDTSFSSDGILTTIIGAGNDKGRSLTVQADGKILVAGISHNGSNNDFALARYNADGTLDTSFDGDGILTTDFGADNDKGYSVTVQTDGKVLVAGESFNGSNRDFAVVRYNADGTLDTSFADDGKLNTAIGSSDDFGHSIAVQADGKILVAGYSDTGSSFEFTVVRYNADGMLDTSFSGDGVLTTDIGSISDISRSMTLQTDGKIVVAGESYNGSNWDFAMVRYNADGTLDTSFESDGKLTTAIGSGDDQIFSVTMQDDGKILASGYSHNGSNNDFVLARYNTDGTLDASFDGDGILTTAIGSGDEIGHSVTVQADGKIVVAGDTFNGFDKDFAVVRYNVDGTLDTTFDTGLLGANPAFVEDSAAVVLDSDVTIFDAELSAADNFDGATLTLVRNGGANADDVYSAAGTLSVLTQGGSLVVGGTTIGTVTTSSAGTLVLTFNSNATNALVNSAMQQIAYSNASDAPPASVQIDWTFSDGNIASQGSGGTMQELGNITVSIDAVNDAPDAVDDTSALNGAEGTTSASLNADLLANDSDLDGDTLSLTKINGTTLIGGVQSIAVTNGTVNVDAADNITFTADADYNGAMSFEYTLSDGALTDTATVSGTISPVNDAPAGADKTVTTDEDTDYTFAGGDFGFSDAKDSPADTLANVFISNAPTNGFLYIDVNGNGQAEGGEVLADSDTVVLADIIAGRLKFKPAVDANGVGYDSFTFQVQDDGGTTNSGVDIDPSPNTITIDVTAVNDAPVISGASNLNPINEDEFNNGGTLISDMISGWVNDGDAAALRGIAVVAVDNTNGSWEYTTNGGTNWYAFGSPNSANARLLASNADTYVRFVPNADWNGTVVDGITFHAWDQTSGTNGGLVNISAMSSVGDDFSNISYANNSGTINWTTDWIEFDKHGGSEMSGHLHVDGVSQQLVLNVGDSGEYIYRQVDLSGATTATLTFDYQNLLGVEDTIALRISGNGGSNYTTVKTFSGSQNTGSDSASIDISGYIASDTRIQFYVIKKDKAESLLIDNVQILYDNPATSTGGDSAFSSVSQSSSIDVNPVDDDPVAVDESITVAEGGTISTLDGGATSVLTNDTDADLPNDTLTVSLDTDVSHGDLTLNPDGTFSYTHNGSENFSDSFTYIVSDANGGVTDSGTVTITINPVNDNNPVAVDESITVNEGATITTLDGGATSVLSNDTDTDLPNDTLTVSLDTDVSHGSLTLNGDGTFSYTHDGSENFSDSFTYIVSDANGGITDSGTVTITINPVNDNNPMAVDESITVSEGGTITTLDGGATSVLSNDTDTDLPNDTLTVSLDTDVSHGSLTLNGDGTFSYTHDGSENFSDSFTYIVSDANGGITDSGTVTITINPVNDNNPMAVDESITVSEGGTITTLDGGATSVLSNDTDTDLPNDTLTVSLDTDVSHGSLTLNSDGTFSYTHDGSENFSDSFTYIVSDANGGITDTGTVTITINPVNDNNPVAVDESITVNEGATITTLNGGATSVLTNDTDTDLPNDTLSVSLDTDVSHGSLTLNPDGTFSYTHDGSENFSDSFTYTVSDANGGVTDSGTVTITINPVNDNNPVAVDESITVNEGATITTLNGGATSVLTNDTDTDLPNDTLSVSLDTDVSHGSLTLNPDGTFSYTHDGSENFSDSFTYTVSDANGGSTDTGTVTITINPVNDNNPVAVDESITVNEGATITTLNGGATSVLTNDTDTDLPNDTLSVSLDTDVSHGSLTLNPDGTFSYTHDGSENFSDSFTYTVSDANGGVTDSGTVTITINPVNDNNPVAVDESITVNEGATITTLDGGAASVLTNDTDTDLPNDTLSVSLDTDVSHGSLTLNPDGTFSSVTPTMAQRTSATRSPTLYPTLTAAAWIHRYRYGDDHHQPGQ